MSDSRAMTWEGKKLNPRDEEKSLDDKLMDLGLLEPGMTLQEKRDLASVLLESSRMAQEQMGQRSEEEQWEVMIMSQEGEKVGDRSTSKKRELIPKTDEPVSEIAVKVRSNAKEDSGGQSSGLNDLLWMAKGNKVEGNERERVDKRDSRRRKEDEKRLGDSGRDGEKVRETSIRKEKRERGVEEEKRKEKEIKKKEEEIERDLRELQKRKRERKGREDGAKGEMGKEKLEKVVEKLEVSVDKVGTLTPNAESRKGGNMISRGSFYGSSSSSDSKHPNPLSSEIYGSTKKNCLPRVPQLSLIQLIEEDKLNKDVKLSENQIRKEKESRKELPKEKIMGAKELAQGSKEKDFFVDKVGEDQSKLSRKYNRGRKLRDAREQEGGKGNPLEEVKVESKNPFRKVEAQGSRDAKKKGERLKDILVTRDCALSSLTRNAEHDQGSFVGNYEKRRRREAESDNSSAEEGVNEVEVQEKVDEEVGDLSGGDVKSPGEKKRRLERGQLTRRWTDVVASKNSGVSGTEERHDIKESMKSKSKDVMMPNKRWRRAKRKFKSSYGSGSEVDEWISSEEDRKTEVEPLSKEQIIARFDDYLIRLKDATQKQRSNEAGEVTNKVSGQPCKNRSKYKVPPGFQEPDSDDEWNLWKICFANKPAAKDKSVREEVKSDAILSSSKMVVTRSRTKQESCPSPHSSSKSPSSSVEDDHAIRSSPLHISPLKAIMPSSSIHPSDETRSTSKSPSLKEITLFDKVACPIPRLSRSTQTLWDDDMDSNHSCSSGSTVIRSIPNSKDVSLGSKPMWDLLEGDTDVEDCEEASENDRRSKSDEGLVDGTPPNITKRKPKIVLRNSLLHLPEEPSEKDAAPCRVEILDDEGTVSKHLTEEPVCGPSVSRKIKGKELKDNTRSLRAQPKGRKASKEVKENSGEESVEQEEVDLTSQEESLPEPVACPICNRIFPMSEIEAHASGCNPEEDNELSEGEAFAELRPRRDQHHKAGRATVAEAGGASHQRFKMDVEEEEDEVDDDFEEGEEYGPSPPQLSSFIPISQQKDSLIDYSDQFPHRSAGVNLQTSLERMRKSLMRGGKRKSGWRKRKRGKWRRVAKK